MTMALYILDTDSVTFQQVGREPILRRLAEIDRAVEGPDLEHAYAQLQAPLRYFCKVNVLSFTTAATARLLTLREQKVRIGTQDLRIAAIALSVNAILVTSNRRDFGQVPGLLTEDWNR